MRLLFFARGARCASRRGGRDAAHLRWRPSSAACSWSLVARYQESCSSTACKRVSLEGARERWRMQPAMHPGLRTWASASGYALGFTASLIFRSLADHYPRFFEGKPGIQKLRTGEPRPAPALGLAVLLVQPRTNFVCHSRQPPVSGPPFSAAAQWRLCTTATCSAGRSSAPRWRGTC